MSEDQDPQRLAFEYEQVQRQLQALDRRLGALEQDLAEIRAALQTLEGLDGEKETMVPLGGGVRIPARVDAGRPVMVGLGAGYHAEVPLDDAVERLKGRRERTESALRSVSADADRLSAEAHRLSERMMQGAGAPPSSS